MYTTRLDPSKAIYVPRGVGNSFQALEDGTAYTYLVNAHWSLEQKRTYIFVNLADPELGIRWPIPLEESERSEADLHHPMLRDARPMAPRRTLVTGCNSQLGHAIRDYVDEHGLEGFEFNDIDTFDFSDPAQYGRLTFTRDMAEAVFHLLDSGAPFGTYDLTGSDAVRSWADIVREVFSIRRRDVHHVIAAAIREREGPGQPASDAFRPVDRQNRERRVPRAGLGGNLQSIRCQGTWQVRHGKSRRPRFLDESIHKRDAPESIPEHLVYVWSVWIPPMEVCQRPYAGINIIGQPTVNHFPLPKAGIEL